MLPQPLTSRIDVGVWAGSSSLTLRVMLSQPLTSRIDVGVWAGSSSLTLRVTMPFVYVDAAGEWHRNPKRQRGSLSHTGKANNVRHRPKLWGFCHTLRHDGIDYGDYIEQITFLLFIRMADKWLKEDSLEDADDLPDPDELAGEAEWNKPGQN